MLPSVGVYSTISTLLKPFFITICDSELEFGLKRRTIAHMVLPDEGSSRGKTMSKTLLYVVSSITEREVPCTP